MIPNLSIPDFGVKFDAEIDVGDVENGDDRVRELRLAWQRWTMPRILTVPFTVPATTGAGNVFTRIGDGPVDQRQWTLKRLIADGAAPVGAAAISSVTATFLFADTTGTSHIAPQNLPGTQERWRFSSFPIQQAWTDEQQVIFGPEDFVIVFVQSGATVALSGQAQVIDEPQYVLDFETWLNTIRE